MAEGVVRPSAGLKDIGLGRYLRAHEYTMRDRVFRDLALGDVVDLF